MTISRIGIVVTCALCGHEKKPIGRSAPLVPSGYCEDSCQGYRMDPRPGSLWPGESSREFGYPISDDGTKQATDPLPKGTDPREPRALAEQQALVLEALAWLSTSLTAINGETNREALRAGAAALRAGVGEAEKTKEENQMGEQIIEIDEDGKVYMAGTEPRPSRYQCVKRKGIHIFNFGGARSCECGEIPSVDPLGNPIDEPGGPTT